MSPWSPSKLDPADCARAAAEAVMDGDPPLAQKLAALARAASEARGTLVIYLTDRSKERIR